MRIFAIIMSVVFVYFATVQYNDPDPYYWIPIYLYPLLLSVLFIYRKTNKLLYLVSAVLYFAGSVYMWPAHWEGVALKNGMKTINIEEGRESLGLAICFATLLIYWIYLNSKSYRDTRSIS